MKTFNRDKYMFTGIVKSPDSGASMYCFKSIRPFFSEELVLVSEAKLLYEDWGFVYFDRSQLNDSSCVNQEFTFTKDLIYNEKKWKNRRIFSKVKLLQDGDGDVGAARCAVYGCAIP